MTAAWILQKQNDAARCASIRLCRRCHAPILQGLDADNAAMTARCDPTPLTEMGEAVALLQGRTTYDLVTVKAGRELHPRTTHFIQKKERRYLIVATHICGNPLAAFTQPAKQKTKVHDDDTPPF